MRIAVGSDHRGVHLRAKLIELLRRLGEEVVDLGTNHHHEDDVDYPDVAAAVARKVASQEADRGILIGGTGLGMCIVANKIPGVRAAPVHDDVTAELSRRHNDLNVLCLSSDIVGERLADRLVEIWIKTPFDGGRHARRNQKIAALERRNGKFDEGLGIRD
jgi:ribose 5-phosphate isomerase B